MKLDKVIELVEKYQIEYRKNSLDSFELSEIYDLFPDHLTDGTYQKWPQTYQHNGRYGVYIITNNEMEVIYIGESTNIGQRLNNYFGYDENKNCFVKDKWKGKPRYIKTIAVKSETWFERLSLEEYLIYNAQPIDNVKSK